MPKHVIIIGSGLGGLACGVILAKNGYHVTILEQEAQAGSCLQCFKRGGVKFETGMHFIGSADKGQTLDRLMHYFEIDDQVKLSKLDTDGYDVISLNGEKYKFAMGRERFINELTSRFPSQRNNLEQYYDLIEAVSNASQLHSLKYADSDSMVNMEYQLRSMDDVISEVITDPVLANVLAGNIPLYAAEKGKTPFSAHAFIMDFYNQSAFRFVGGSDTLAIALIHTIQRYGGQLILNTKVDKIICDETHATAVKLDNGKTIDCDYVISDAHPMRTLEMLDTNLIRKAYRERVNAIPQTVGGFSVYLKFKHDSMPYMNHNFYGYNASTPWGCENYDEQSWPKGYLYMHMCHEDSPKYAQSGVILSYMHFSEVERWLGTSVGHRGNDYKEFKLRKAEKLISLVEKDIPNIRDHIAEYYTSTPLTYLNYTGTEGGGMYGIKKDINNTSAYRVSQRTRVPNVYQTGQNINSHGMLGVLVGAIVTCSEFLTSNTIYQQIIEANR